MPTDEELYELWDTASTVKTSSFEPDVFDHAKGLRAVYDSGQAAATAAERERCARIAEEYPSFQHANIAAAIRADREPEPEVLAQIDAALARAERGETVPNPLPRREPEPATEAKTKDEAMVVCRIISAVDNNEYRGAKQLLASDWLRERDAEKWDEGHAYGFYDQSENTKHSNPYRKTTPATEEGSNRD